MSAQADTSRNSSNEHGDLPLQSVRINGVQRGTFTAGRCSRARPGGGADFTRSFGQVNVFCSESSESFGVLESAVNRGRYSSGAMVGNHDCAKPIARAAPDFIATVAGDGKFRIDDPPPAPIDRVHEPRPVIPAARLRISNSPCRKRVTSKTEEPIDLGVLTFRFANHCKRLQTFSNHCIRCISSTVVDRLNQGSSSEHHRNRVRIRRMHAGELPRPRTSTATGFV